MEDIAPFVFRMDCYEEENTRCNDESIYFFFYWDYFRADIMWKPSIKTKE